MMSRSSAASTTTKIRLLALVSLAAAALISLSPISEAGKLRLASLSQQWASDEHQKFVQELRAKDTCGAVFSSKVHGYEVKEYQVTTKDNYVLTLHRLIHPKDAQMGAPPARAKKPYLLLHGLVGTSASYVMNVPPNYQAPPETFDANPAINEILWNKANDYEFTWQSTADYFDENTKEKHDHWLRNSKQSALMTEIDYDADLIPFAREFKQSHRKFHLPKDAKDFISNSLAFTLSNFGYDVWLINLRGNNYSKKHAGRYNSDSPEYWDFNIDTLIREDLLASINFVAKTTEWPGPLGFVSYSYTSTHVLGLLTSYPAYQDTLQPVVMIAPTLLTGIPERSKLKYVVKFATDLFMSSNGPFPAIGRVKEDRIEKLLCRLPLASKLCKLLETILYGKPKSLTNLVFSDKQTDMIKHDTDCGQTSKQVLYQLIENLQSPSVHEKFSPFTSARTRVLAGRPVRRSIMLIHSQDDDVATMADVAKIRDTALRLLALSDYVIKKRNFSHSDFLFGEENDYLVNAEIMRQIRLFDFMIMFSTPDLQAFGQKSYANRGARGQAASQQGAPARGPQMAQGPGKSPARSLASASAWTG